MTESKHVERHIVSLKNLGDLKIQFPTQRNTARLHYEDQSLRVIKKRISGITTIIWNPEMQSVEKKSELSRRS